MYLDESRAYIMCIYMFWYAHMLFHAFDIMFVFKCSDVRLHSAVLKSVECFRRNIVQLKVDVESLAHPDPRVTQRDIEIFNADLRVVLESLMSFSVHFLVLPGKLDCTSTTLRRARVCLTLSVLVM